VTAAEFFNVKTVEDALAALYEHWCPQPHVVRCPTVESNGRVVARAPLSPTDLPEFVRSSMDGYAVRAADTFGASASLPAYLKCLYAVRMGESPDFELKAGEAAEISTGAQIPHGADAVVIIERTQKFGANEIEVLAPVAPGENLVQIGEDVQVGSVILPVGHRIRPQDIGGMLAVGVLEVEVAVPPRVAIIGSGDELVAPEDTPQSGQIRDINSYILAALAQSYGAEAVIGGIAADTFDDLYRLARRTLDQADMLVISAGSSVSTRDLTGAVIEKLGAPGVIQHGLAVKPGKPTLLAVCDGKVVIGLPGNPVSALLVARQILIPVIRRALGEAPPRVGTVRATLTANIASTTGREDTIPVRLTGESGSTQAQPIFGKSNLIYTLVKADGVVVVPLNSGGLKVGSQVDVVLFS
jgi:molybdopterin molybdotransferase